VVPEGRKVGPLTLQTNHSLSGQALNNSEYFREFKPPLVRTHDSSYSDLDTAMSVPVRIALHAQLPIITVN